MYFLVVALLCSVALGFLFKIYARMGLDLFQVIVFNYITCVLCGWGVMGEYPISESSLRAPWAPYALILGFLFVSGFNGAALTVKYYGVTISQVMQKMSILMTVPFAIVVLGEQAGIRQYAGIVAAVAAIVLINWPAGADSPARAPRRSPMLLLIPVMTWLLSGLIEVLFLEVNRYGYTVSGTAPFVTNVFGVASVLGMLVAVVGWVSGHLRFDWRCVLGGVVLGIPNYGSMYFLMQTLSIEPGVFVFPVLNIGIIALTTIGAVLVFKEKLGRVQTWGLGAALIAIMLMSY
ncbi:MAG: EamA family transporter [Saprospiraceae bacterium]